jgi:hypothetical protein
MEPDDAPWGDDDGSWWHQLDLEMQQREELERKQESNNERTAQDQRQ